MLQTDGLALPIWKRPTRCLESMVEITLTLALRRFQLRAPSHRSLSDLARSRPKISRREPRYRSHLSSRKESWRELCKVRKAWPMRLRALLSCKKYMIRPPLGVCLMSGRIQLIEVLPNIWIHVLWQTILVISPAPKLPPNSESNAPRAALKRIKSTSGRAI